jgi:glycosyltransferase involved in cell wall biosynthesis
MRVLHVIIGLNVGGAETMLSRLVCSFGDSSTHIHSVVSLTDLGAIGSQLQANGVKVNALGMSSAVGMPLAFWKLFRLMRLERPDIVQTWMYHSDLIGGLAARLAGIHAVIWGVRSTAIPQGRLSATYWIIRLCSILSWFVPRRIVCCANSAKLAHIRLRYSPQKMIVIPNGYDFGIFDSSIRLRSLARQELGFDDVDIVIGVVGRFDLLKDYHNFVTAASHLANTTKKVKFLMIGRGNEWSNATLGGWIKLAGLGNHFQLLGQRLDVPYFLSAMDIFCLSSMSEAFPNVVVEAMAMGLPCAVTRAGDAADILGDDGFVVTVKDSVALADALKRICELTPDKRKTIGERNAKCVREKYDIKRISQQYEDLYREVCGK